MHYYKRADRRHGIQREAPGVAEVQGAERLTAERLSRDSQKTCQRARATAPRKSAGADKVAHQPAPSLTQLAITPAGAP